MTCGFQSGAWYHISPTRMSFLPSLSTSATATPSERNLVSRTTRCQTIFVFLAPDFAGGVLSWAGASEARTRSAREASERCRMVALVGWGYTVDYRDGGPGMQAAIREPDPAG